jgi:hypothetical protein
VRLPGILCLRITKTTSSSVRSDCFSIRPSRKSACLSKGETLPPRGLAAQRPVSRKHLTQIIAVLARDHACPQNRPSASPVSQKRINADRLSYSWRDENPPDSIGAERALAHYCSGHPRGLGSPERIPQAALQSGLDKPKPWLVGNLLRTLRPLARRRALTCMSQRVDLARATFHNSSECREQLRAAEALDQTKYCLGQTKFGTPTKC